MNLNKFSRLSTAIAATLLASATTAAAQESPASDSTQTLDRVNVTGSRIAREGFVTPSPVTGITAEEIRATGAVTIGDLMTKMPALSPTYTLGNSTRFIGTAGLGLVDLRGMGTSRTLVLVNGRRHVGASPGSTAVDVNTIPVEWIERVEVITGGASAVYGADAVAGVVNFITKKSFDGIEMRAQTGGSGEGNFGRSFVSVSGGSDFADGRGSAAISIEHSQQDRFSRTGREIGRRYQVSRPNPNYDPTQPSSESNPQTIFDGPGGNHAISYGGTFNVGTFNPANPTTRYQFLPDGSFVQKRYDGWQNANSCIDCDFTDLNALADLEPKFDRTSVNAIFTFDLNDDHRVFAEAKYSKTESHFYGQSAFDQPIRIRADNAYITPELQAFLAANPAALSTTTIGDTPYQFLAVNRMNVDAGRRGEQVDRDTKRLVVGLEGFLSENWAYEASVNYGESSISRVNLNNRINERWQAGLDTVLDANGNIACRVTVDPTAINIHTGNPYNLALVNGCVPFSIFGNGAVAANPAAAAWFNTNSLNTSKLKQTVYSASVSNNALFSLPAGDVGFAAGVEHRKEESQENTDPLSALGLTFLNAISSRGGAYDVSEIFAETSIPVLADLPGVERLSIDLAGRYSDYDTIGSTKTWNIGIDWEILSSLRFRGTTARAVRAPGIGELFNPQSQNFAFIDDPCNTRVTNPNRPSTAPDVAVRQANCAALGIPANWEDTFTASRPGVSGGNPNLRAEEAETVSFGFVWQPEFVKGLGVSIDYWRITLDDAIGAVSGQTNATRCVDSPGGVTNNIFCDQILRAPSGGFVDPQGRDFPSHSIYSWSALNENLAKKRRVGVDFEIDYRFDLLGGNAVTRLVGTRLLQSREWEFQDFPNEYKEWVTSVWDPRYRANFEASYDRDEWNLSWTMRYMHHVLRVEPASYQSNPGQSSPIRNGSYTYHNAQIGYTFPDSDIKVYLGIDNVFDKDPPLNYFGADVNQSFYDSVGRFMYLGATYKF
ncbi:TonB-dependent receptor [Luteimonas sp. FCS-9]|uniref:TonB-dependent receptor domain-containing protein n=1 Tax=Luteimonas sp. FCS-9 TaxID=1547516 RepID=UPI00063E775F|nr:TonB-dependent receptor [Luteimonas sp. FCS-9]KLJ01408.1 TonB-dependent receptor [Luteimonas sp. FCS-9]